MVKAGYKETEIGVIPKEWDLCSIEHNFDFYPNNTYARDCMNEATGSVRNIHYGDVLIKFGSILDCERDSIPFINLGIPVNTVNRTVQSGDIIMADTAEDETVGKAVEVINVGSKKIVSGLHTFFLRPHADLFVPRYLGYFINATVYHNQLLPHIVGTKVSSVSKKSLNETIILRPPLPEQRRIAEALSDIDTLITNLEKLIAKKKAIKQGAMQLLLTGKKRLPGFISEWKRKTIADIASVINGDRGANYPKPNEILPIGIPFINAGHLVECRVNYDHMDYISQEHYLRMGGVKLQPNDILFCLRGSLGKYALYRNRSGALASSLAAIRPILTEVNPCYLLQLVGFNIITKQIEQSNNGSSQPNLSATDLKKFEIIIPEIDEQDAIACALSDIDSEIEELEKKLSKYRNIKIGMMQTLLTGKIRLTEQEAPTVVIPFSNTETPPKPEAKPHNQQFDDAVAIAAIVAAFYSGKYPLGRKKVQKLLYLLRRRQDASIAAFKKKAAGPYADEVRYKGGEPIATRNGYITVNKSNQGSMFSKGKSIQKALEYVSKWEMQPDVDWLVAQFLHTKVNTLELLATIDMAMCDLEGSGITASVDSVKKLISSDKEWRAKLKKTYFSDDDIGWAITECLNLFNTTGR